MKRTIEEASQKNRNESIKQKMDFRLLDSQPLGSWQAEELKVMNAYLESIKTDPHHHTSGIYADKDYVTLRTLCEEYIQAPKGEMQAETLKAIANDIAELKKKDFPPSGAYMPYKDLNSYDLIRLVYESEAQPLIDLFAKQLPKRTSEYYLKRNLKVPPSIVDIENRANTAVTEFINKNKPASFDSLEKTIVNIQRLYRAKIRKREERIRIPKTGGFTEAQLNHMFQGPYTPQLCSPKLANRIFQAAKKVRFLNAIRHITCGSNLSSILDNGLLGRKTLVSNLMQFAPNKLSDNDIADGDANVICFGSNYGDIDCTGSIEFSFQFDKLDFGRNKSVHNAFFKQRDLGFNYAKSRSVKLGDNRIEFNHSSEIRRPVSGYCGMVLHYKKNRSAQDICVYSLIPKFHLISYDIQHVEAVLILNFFRCLDNLKDPCGKRGEDSSATDTIKEIYRDIEAMGDNALAEFLASIGQNFSDTMEFNFFGAHQINFDALTHIKNKERYTLTMVDLLAELQQGILTQLNIAKQNIPQIFQSYRFIDYLATKTNHPQSLQELSSLRALCKSPGWYPMNDKYRQAEAERKSDVSTLPSATLPQMRITRSMTKKMNGL